eukprot:2302205-Rhodomonas_salina.1
MTILQRTTTHGLDVFDTNAWVGLLHLERHTPPQHHTHHSLCVYHSLCQHVCKRGVRITHKGSSATPVPKSRSRYQADGQIRAVGTLEWLCLQKSSNPFFGILDLRARSRHLSEQHGSDLCQGDSVSPFA